MQKDRIRCSLNPRVLLVIFSFCFMQTGQTQSNYFHSFTTLYHYDFGALLCDTCLLFGISNVIVNVGGGVSFGPDGYFYTLSSSGDQLIHRIDTLTGQVTLVFDGPDDLVPMECSCRYCDRSGAITVSPIR